MKKFIIAAAIAASSLFAVSAAEAQITANFAFTGGFQFGYGMVTGHLTFANAGTGVAATGVYIDSSTDYFGNAYAPTFGGENLLNILAVVPENAFTVSSTGAVTSADFNGREFFSSLGANVFFQLNAFGGFNTYSVSNANFTNESTGNQGGFAGATYTPAATSPVPEPVSWAMMIAGTAVVGAAMRRRRVSARVAIA